MSATIRVMSEDKKPWYKQSSMREAMGGPKQERVGDLVLENSTTLIYKKQRYPIVGAEARVESVGELQRRITATRLLTTGVFAFALKKKADDRELYLTVTAPDYQFVVELDPKKGADARTFAAKINTLARAQQPVEVRPDVAASPPPGWYFCPGDPPGSERLWDGAQWTANQR